jgi:hypothetical protein
MAALRIVVLAGVVGCLLGVSGCPEIEFPPMELQEEYVLRSDLSGTLTQQLVLVAEELPKEEDIDDMESETAKLRSKLPPGGSAERILRGNRLGIRWTVPFSDLRQLKGELIQIDHGLAALCDLSCKRRGLTLECRGTVAEGADGFSTYTLKITMPGKIRRANADKTQGRTAIWSSAKKRRIEVACICPAPWLVAMAGFAIVGVAGAVPALLRRTKNSRPGDLA